MKTELSIFILLFAVIAVMLVLGLANQPPEQESVTWNSSFTRPPRVAPKVPIPPWASAQIVMEAWREEAVRLMGG